MLLKIDKNSLKLSKKFLETPEAWLWVGSSYGSIDNDDERVIKTREFMEKYYPYVPYGMWVGNKDSKGKMEPIMDIDNDGFYDVDLSWWPVGVYRFNIHTVKNENISVKKRDTEVKWAQIYSEGWNEEEMKNMISFIHKEENGAGYCLRILIRPDRTVEAMGDNS